MMLMIRLGTILCLLTVQSLSATYYASYNGSSTDGTQVAPWSPRYAVTNTTATAGDTIIWLDGGTVTINDYHGDPYTVTNSLRFTRSGTAESPITHRAQSRYGGPVFNCSLLIPYTTQGLIIEGLTVRQSWWTNRNVTNHWKNTPGINIYGSNITVRGNFLDNVGHPAISGWRFGYNKRIEGNIVRFPGIRDWSTDGPVSYDGDYRGSGIYIENDDTECVINGNVFVYPLTQGILWKNDVFWFRNTNNVVIDAGAEAFLFEHKDDRATNFALVSSDVWMKRSGGAGLTTGNDLYTSGWYGSNILIFNNTIAGALKGLNVKGHWVTMSVLTNTFVRLGTFGDGSSEQTGEYNVAEIEEAGLMNYAYAWNFSGNSYRASGTNNWFFASTNTAGWTAFTNVTKSTSDSHAVTLPTGLTVRAFRPYATATFIYVTVFNWDGAASTTIDVTGYFTPGSAVRLTDLQNAPFGYDTTVSSDSLTLDLDRTEYTEMLGSFASRTGGNAWTGINDTRFRVFEIAAVTSSGTTLNTGNMTVQGVSTFTQ